MISTALNKRWEDVLPGYPDQYFDIAACDIPYGINVGNMHYLTEIKKTTRQKNGYRLTPNKKKTVYKIKDWDKNVPGPKYFDELRRVSVNQIIFGIDYVQWDGVGTGRIRWDKVRSDKVSFNRYEVAYCSLITDTIDIPLLWNGMQQAKSLSEPTTQQGNKKLNEKRIHPCHKPVMLYDLLFKMFANPSMKILDTHLGSGSSRISAAKFGIAEFVGCEVDEEYFDDQEYRWKKFTSQQRLFV